MALFTLCLKVCNLLLALNLVCGDDRMLCCMRGLKQMKSIELCPAPCCPGFQEVVADPPSLSPMVWCEREVRPGQIARNKLPVNAAKKRFWIRRK